MASLVFSTQKPESITALYVFGDSLSDVGTVFRATGGLYPPNPPYFQGRYSNGQVWVEYLANRLQLAPDQTQNFAYGGATTTNEQNSLVPGLLTQVQAFLKTQPKLRATDLCVVWAGANDYLQGTTNAKVPVENVTTAIAQLAGAGAQTFLVANLPDLGRLPSTRTSSTAANLTQLTQAHNQTLRRSLKQLNQQYPDLQIATLDAGALYQNAIAKPADFGFRNVTSACLEGSRVCPNPEQFLFWDGIHPTTAAHRQLGEAAFSAIQTAGVF